MAPALLPEFDGALCHVISRGAVREDIFDDDGDREAFLEILGRSLIAFTGCATPTA